MNVVYMKFLGGILIMEMLKSPLAVRISTRKKHILNLNTFRNTHYRVLNNAKISYKETMKSKILNLKDYKKLLIIYKVFKGDRRRFDIGNILSIHQKFFEDALVELGKLPDDKASNIPMVVYLNGGIDVENPRVEIHLFDMEEPKEIQLAKAMILQEVRDTYE